MGYKSLHELNNEYLKKKRSKRRHHNSAIDIAFWVSAILILVAVLSFNYNSFLTRPIFGYSLYLTENEKNLLLVKSTDDFDPTLTAETIYKTDSTLTSPGVCSNNHQTVEIGIVKATFPKLGKLVSFMISKVYIILIPAVGLVAYVLARGVRK